MQTEHSISYATCYHFGENTEYCITIDFEVPESLDEIFLKIVDSAGFKIQQDNLEPYNGYFYYVGLIFEGDADDPHEDSEYQKAQDECANKINNLSAVFDKFNTPLTF